MRIPPGTEHDIVRDVQEKLADAGFDRAETTGVLDDQTREALAAFQTEHDIQATGQLDEATLGVLDVDVSVADEAFPIPEYERRKFTHLLAKNPNYFGNQPDASVAAVEPLEQDTSYEELQCVGYEPEMKRLEAVVHVKRTYGYGGGVCSSGTPEYVRFYLEDQDDPNNDWKDVGMGNVTVYDVPGSKPLEYGVSIEIDPEEEFCSVENLPEVRAILSWNQPPPANSPNWTPVWGNVRDATIQIDAASLFNFGDLFDEFQLDIPTPILEGIDFEQELSYQPLSLDDASLAESYEQTSVPPHRFGFSQLTKQIEQPALLEAEEPGLALDSFSGVEFDFDADDVVDDLLETQGDTYYEELDCVGLTRGGLNAVITLKQSNGYSGDLCSAGSDEYVAFWEWDPDANRWDHLGTTSVNAHDIDDMPSNGLKYAAFLPATLSHRQQPCSDGASTVRIRATLSWEQPPPSDDPYWTPTWGNSMETRVHVPPGPAVEDGDTEAYLDTIGSMAPCDIDQPSGLANGPDSSTLGGGFVANESPFGGTVVVTGTIVNPPQSLSSGVDPIEYRVRVRPLDETTNDPIGPWRSVKNTFSVRVREKHGSGPPVSKRMTKKPDDDGFYEYLHDPAPEPWRYVLSNRLVEWETGGKEGKWELKLETKDPDDGTIEPAEPIDCTEGGTRSSVILQLDNTQPEASLEITDVEIGGTGNTKTANECGKIERGANGDLTFPAVGDTIHGKYTAKDEYILRRSFSVTPASHAGSASISPGTKTYTLSGSGEEDADWSLDTTGMDSCGFNGRIHVRDRTIVHSRRKGWRSGDIVGFCLEDSAETDGGTATTPMEGTFESVDGPMSGLPLAIGETQFDSPGEDHENLNEEFVTIDNVGDEPLDLGNWRIEDDYGHAFEFPEDFELAAGSAVTVRSGSGEDSATELYWGAERAVWDNTGDSVFLYDDTDALVLKESY